MNIQPDIESLKTLFHRDASGNYKFGEERVSIKIDQNKQIYIEHNNQLFKLQDFIESKSNIYSNIY